MAHNSSTINIKLNVKEIERARKKIERYANMQIKLNTFTQRLAKIGIETITDNISGSPYQAYISVQKRQISAGQNSNKVTVLIKNRQLKTEKWYVQENGKQVLKSADVNPVLFQEFGSGKFAVSSETIPQAGRGKFPNQTHANENYWRYLSADDNKWHINYGFSPTRPMWESEQKMISEIESIAKEVFGVW